MIYNFLRSHSLVFSLSIYAETFFAGLNCLIYSLNINHESPSSLFHLEILNSDFLTKFWRNYRQSLQRLSTRVCKYFRPFESLPRLSFFADFGGNYSTEFRFESPISISKWNNWLDFRRKSENYFKVKVFSDSRPKSAQKLILKVFSDSKIQIICRLSNFFKILIWCYTCARMVFLFASLLREQKAFDKREQTVRWFLYGQSMISGRWEHR